MKTSALALALAPLVAVACNGPLAGEEPRIEELSAFVGSWQGTHRVLGDDTAYPATYEIRRSADGEKLIWEFSSEWNGGFTGRSEMHWDAEAGEWIEAWTDSTEPDESDVMTFTWYPDTGTILAENEGEDWQDPETEVTYRHVTELDGEDSWHYVMHVVRDDGTEQEVMWIDMQRAE